MNILGFYRAISSTAFQISVSTDRSVETDEVLPQTTLACNESIEETFQQLLGDLSIVYGKIVGLEYLEKAVRLRRTLLPFTHVWCSATQLDIDVLAIKTLVNVNDSVLEPSYDVVCSCLILLIYD